MSSCVSAEINLTFYEGGTFDQSFQWKTGTPAVPVNLSGYTGAMKIRAKKTDSTPLLSLPSVDSVWEADGETGIYVENRGAAGWWWRIYIKDNDSIGLAPTHRDIPEGVYDLFLYSATGEAVLKQYGTANIVASVTR